MKRGVLRRCRPAPIVWVLAAGVAVVGCGAPTPTGQVVAIVAGQDVTRRDLAAEVSIGALPAHTAEEMRGPVLEIVVDRKLLVARALREGLDRSPEYLAAVRRQREVTLAAMVERQIAAQVAQPTLDQARAAVRDHDDPAALSAAQATVWRQRLSDRLSSVLEAERARADVRYQPGYGPAAR